MINASYGGQTYSDVDTLVATDGTNSATVTLTESGVVPTPTGTKSITANGTGIDVTNYASVDVAVPSGGDTPTGTITINANGTGINVASYAYADVSVPNSYSAGDNGKVVSNGSLVSQTSATYTSNNTYDTTLINSVTVNVSGGGSTGYSVSDVATGNFGTRLEVPDVSIRQYAFSNSTTIESAFVGCTTSSSIGVSAFRGCTSLETMVVPYTDNTSSDFCNGCTSLEAIDFGPNISAIPTRGVTNCEALTKIIFRKISAVCGTNNVTNLDGTPFASGGTGGTIYIPEVLYNHLGDGTNLDYKSNAVWSLLDAAGTITWAKIEGSAYENAYVDGTPISS